MHTQLKPTPEETFSPPRRNTRRDRGDDRSTTPEKEDNKRARERGSRSLRWDEDGRHVRAKEKNDRKDSKGIQGNTDSDTSGFLMAQHMRFISCSALRTIISSGSVCDLCILLKANS